MDNDWTVSGVRQDSRRIQRLSSAKAARVGHVLCMVVPTKDTAECQLQFEVDMCVYIAKKASGYTLCVYYIIRAKRKKNTTRSAQTPRLSGGPAAPPGPSSKYIEVSPTHAAAPPHPRPNKLNPANKAHSQNAA